MIAKHGDFEQKQQTNKKCTKKIKIAHSDQLIRMEFDMCDGFLDTHIIRHSMCMLNKYACVCAGRAKIKNIYHEMCGELAKLLFCRIANSPSLARLWWIV